MYHIYTNKIECWDSVVAGSHPEVTTLQLLFYHKPSHWDVDDFSPGPFFPEGKMWVISFH